MDTSQLHHSIGHQPTFPERGQLFSSRQSGKARCERGWNWKPKPLTDYDLWYVVSGEGSLQLNGNRHPLSAGCCFVLRPGDRIVAEQDDERRLSVIYVHFRAAGTDEALYPVPPLPPCVQLADTAWLEALLNRLLVLDDSGTDAVDDAEFDALLRAALCVLAREASAATNRADKHHATIRRTIRLIKEHAASPPSREQLAEQAELTPRYLNALFKQHTGVSLKTFIARARIERASHLLAESTMNVSQIADTLGYSDIYFFSKQFKQFVGESPLRYRSRVLEPMSHHATGVGAPTGRRNGEITGIIGSTQ